MATLKTQLTSVVNGAEDVLEKAVIDWIEAQEKYSNNDRVLFLAAQTVEMASIYANMTRASRGLCVYISGEAESEYAKTDLYEAFQALDHIHTKAPNERLQIAREYLLEAMFVVKGEDIEKSRELLYTTSQIADTARLSVIEHIEAIRQAVYGDGTTLH